MESHGDVEVMEGKDANVCSFCRKIDRDDEHRREKGRVGGREGR